MSGPEVKPERRYTWSDYIAWDDDRRWEIIRGEAFAMTPGPTDRHQILCANLAAALVPFFRDGPCRVLVAPTDVKLSEEDVVQPDLLVVCDEAQFRGHIEGPPTLVVEILSPSTEGHDRVRKLPLYARHGVREYWIVRPHPAVLEVLTLDAGSYRVHETYDATGTLDSPAFPGLKLRLHDVFDFPIPPEERVQEIRESRPPYAEPSTT